MSVCVRVCFGGVDTASRRRLKGRAVEGRGQGRATCGPCQRNSDEEEEPTDDGNSLQKCSSAGSGGIFWERRCVWGGAGGVVVLWLTDDTRSCAAALTLTPRIVGG